MRWIASILLAGIGAPLMVGCTTVRTGGEGSTRFVLGLVRIDLPATQGNLSAVAVKSLGIGWNQGPFLGWNDSSWVIAQPNECQMVVIIRSSVEAEQAARVLEQLKGEKICVADYSNSLSRQPR